jgi:ferrochelatase
MTTSRRTGVLLLNLGGPQRLEDVRPFLFNLFSDRQIIRLGPAFLQSTIARLIAWRRAPKSQANYRLIGGGSPILEKTMAQARALETLLAEHGEYLVRPCMRYWHPFADQALKEMATANVERIIALPLYPHYSIATTGSSLTDLNRARTRLGLDLPIHAIHSWPDQPDYIAALAARVEAGLAHPSADPVEILYSAHSLPVRFIEEGDPYVDDLHRTIAALERLTGRPGRLCYQSRSGPVEWLGPSTPEGIGAIAATGGSSILVVPLSFVSDHVETLVEIDIQYRQLAESLGLGFAVTAALNDDPRFIAGLADLVLGCPDSGERG